MNCQSRFDAGYRMLGAGTLGTSLKHNSKFNLHGNTLELAVLILLINLFIKEQNEKSGLVGKVVITSQSCI